MTAVRIGVSLIAAAVLGGAAWLGVDRTRGGSNDADRIEAVVHKDPY